jgi:hypothetical protein
VRACRVHVGDSMRRAGDENRQRMKQSLGSMAPTPRVYASVADMHQVHEQILAKARKITRMLANHKVEIQNGIGSFAYVSAFMLQSKTTKKSIWYTALIPLQASVY